MTRSSRGYSRKEVFSNPTVQWKIVTVFSAVAAVFIATNYHVVHRLLSALSNNVSRLPLSIENRADLVLILEQQEHMLDIQLAIFTFLSIFLLVMGGVLLSHRIGGPLFQMKQYMDEMVAGTGTPREIRFRKRDFFHDLADSFNNFQKKRGILLESAEPTDDSESG